MTSLYEIPWEERLFHIEQMPISQLFLEFEFPQMEDIIRRGEIGNPEIQALVNNLYRRTSISQWCSLLKAQNPSMDWEQILLEKSKSLVRAGLTKDPQTFFQCWGSYKKTLFYVQKEAFRIVEKREKENASYKKSLWDSMRSRLDFDPQSSSPQSSLFSRTVRTASQDQELRLLLLPLLQKYSRNSKGFIWTVSARDFQNALRILKSHNLRIDGKSKWGFSNINSFSSLTRSVQGTGVTHPIKVLGSVDLRLENFDDVFIFSFEADHDVVASELRSLLEQTRVGKLRERH